MGFIPEQTIYTLEFSGKLEGLEVKMGSLSVREYNKMIRLMSVDVQAEAADAGEDIVKMFAESLISWNVEDKAGAIIPTTLEGVESQEQSFIFKVFTAWQRAMGGDVSDDLEKDSSSGAITLEASLGMGGQSASLPSGQRQS